MAIGISTTVADTMLGAFDTSYIQMHTGDPGAAGTANVLASTNRLSAGFASATTNSTVRQRANTSLIRWDSGNLPGASGTVTHVSLWSASTAGTFQRSITLTASAAIVSGQPAEIAAGALIVNVGPLAA